MGQRLGLIGFILFLIGIGLYLLQPPSVLTFLIPVFTIGGVCMLVISTFLSMKKSR